MIKNYILATFRNLARNKLVSLISIIGLAIGITYSLLIFLYVQFAFTYDSFHDNLDHIYRVVIRGVSNNKEQIMDKIASIHYNNIIPGKVGKRPTLNFNEEQIVRLSPVSGYFRKDKNMFFEDTGCFLVDDALFNIFNFSLSDGSLEGFYSEPFSIILSQEMAEKYFGEENPVGRDFQCALRDTRSYLTLKVQGVLNPIPRNSHLRVKFLIPFKLNPLLDKRYQGGENENTPYDLMTYTYMLIKDKQEKAELEKQLNKIVPLNLYPEIPAHWIEREYLFLPLNEYYLNSPILPDNPGYKERDFIFLLILTVIFVIGSSCINIMNLFIARSTTRINEIGIRKTIGARPAELRIQFLLESFVICLLASVLALSFVEIILPEFARMFQEPVNAFNSKTPWFAAIVLAITSVFAIMSWLFPGLILSSVKPYNPERYNRITFARRIRRFLVAVQLVTSIFLAICSAEITGELSELISRDFGFEEENVLIINRPMGLFSFRLQDYEAFKSQLKQIDGVLGVASSSSIPWQQEIKKYNLFLIKPHSSYFDINCILADQDFLDVYKIPLKEGFFIPKTEASIYRGKIIFNEATKILMGLENVEEAKIHLSTSPVREGQPCDVLGVTENFKFTGLFDTGSPLILYLTDYTASDRWEFLSIRLDDIKNKAAINKIERLWDRWLPEEPMNMQVLKDILKQKHSYFKRNFDKIMNFAALIAILISSISLFALADYEGKRRVREIGIRKSLGATPLQILLEVLKDYISMTGIANLIAWPVAFIALQGVFRFLNFSGGYYPDFKIYLFAGIISAIIVFLTVSSQTLRAALINPADSLRYE